MSDQLGAEGTLAATDVSAHAAIVGQVPRGSQPDSGGVEPTSPRFFIFLLDKKKTLPPNME